MSSLDVLRVVGSGFTAAFRPPFFHRPQPTYPIPPPSTIYGLVASVLGYLPDPKSFRAGYNFISQYKCTDFQNTWITLKTGHTQGILDREMLIDVDLVLYLNRPDWAEMFLQPVYNVVLGRSSDLFCIDAVDIVTLTKQDRCTFHHCLLPEDMLIDRSNMTPIKMTKYIDENRNPYWGVYLYINGSPFHGPGWEDRDLHERFVDHKSINPLLSKLPERGLGVCLMPFC